MKDTPVREVWIDTVRGIAILLVVLGHIDMGSHPLGKWIYSFHIPLFFLLSGFLVAERYASYLKKPLSSLLWHKTKQYLYPYFTFSALALIYAVCRFDASAAVRIIRYTLMLEGYSALWFLPALWIAECALLILLRSRFPLKGSAVILFLGTSAYAFLQYYAIGGAEPASVGAKYQVMNTISRGGGWLFVDDARLCRA